jgi:cytochrome b561
MLKNTQNSFGTIGKAFHWLIAVCIVGMVRVGVTMTDMDSSPRKMVLYSLHKSTGTLFLLFVILAFVWRLLSPIPRLPGSLHPWHRRLAKLSPVVLYGLLFLIPLSGIALSQAAGYPITVYSLFTLPNIFPKDPELSKIALMVHQYGAFTLIGVVSLHTGAALYHHFILKTNVLQRMLPSWLQRF